MATWHVVGGHQQEHNYFCVMGLQDKYVHLDRHVYMSHAIGHYCINYDDYGTVKFLWIKILPK